VTISACIISRRPGCRRAGSPSAGAADDPCRMDCSWGTACPPRRSHTRARRPRGDRRAPRTRCRLNVRITPASGPPHVITAGLKSATTGREQAQQHDAPFHSITLSARIKRACRDWPSGPAPAIESRPQRSTTITILIRLASAALSPALAYPV
jgi:hypothetical protein